MSASGGPGALQMVSELNTERCDSEEAVPRRGVDTRRCASKDAGSQRAGGFGGGLSSIGERNER